MDKKILLVVYDENDYLKNVLVALTLKFSIVIYFHRQMHEGKRQKAIVKLLKRNKITAYFMHTAKSAKLFTELFRKYPTAAVDVTNNNYLTLRLFEKAILNQSAIYYYDNSDNTVKDYRQQEAVEEATYKLTIADFITLSGAKIDKQLHLGPEFAQSTDLEILKSVFEKSITAYPAFINYMSSLAQLLAGKGNELILSEAESARVKTNKFYPLLQEFGIINCHEQTFSVKNDYFRALIANGGAWLENYLCIILKESQLFDECAMSTVINFKSPHSKEPVTCEIDLLVLKDNYLLFISCKSNKVDTAALNEIKLHDYFFGNHSSNAVVCTVEDLNIKNQNVYRKAIELGVSVIDFTSLAKHDAAKQVLNIIDRKYQYEKVKGS